VQVHGPPVFTVVPDEFVTVAEMVEIPVAEQSTAHFSALAPIAGLAEKLFPIRTPNDREPLSPDEEDCDPQAAMNGRTTRSRINAPVATDTLVRSCIRKDASHCCRLCGKVHTSVCVPTG